MTKKENRKSDPYKAREAEKYDRPIPSREYILELLQQAAHPLKRDYFVQYFKLDAEEQEAIRRRLNAMMRDGQILKTRKGYVKPSFFGHVQGRLSIEKEGQGKLMSSEGIVIISPRDTVGLFDGDEVKVEVTGYDRQGRLLGQIAEVISRVTPTCVGKICKENNVVFVRPIDRKVRQDILLLSQDTHSVKPDEIVLVEILRDEIQSDKVMYPGKLLESLGERTTPGIEIETAKRKYDLPWRWPDEVLTAAQKISLTLPKAEIEKRVDLRHLNFVTIDGEDAKDFDDAVFCEPRRPNGFRLFVAIADVSYYVKPGSALDTEAKLRGTSVYFPGHVIPMLPEKLSNGLCSLKPDEDRFSLVCEMCIQPDGKISRAKFYEAVFRSKARLTYTQVANFLENKGEFGSLASLKDDIDHLHQVFLALLKQRSHRGAIDFDLEESKILFNRSGKIKQIVPLTRNVAHRVIEECMLAANVSAAKFLLKQKMPTLFRVHESPPHDKLYALREFLGEFGLSLTGQDEPSAKDFQKLLNGIAGRNDAHVIQTVMLRSLSQAKYSPKNIGHFGLSYESYLHFTSPIRRYPDLMVHRAIKKALHDQTLSTDKELELLGEHCSQTERRADEATRDAVMSLKCEFMEQKLGQVFEGTISSVVPFGIFVELKDIYVEGLVHVTSLGQDYFIYDAKRHRMIGDRTRRMYKLGDKVTVKVARVSIEEQKIDLEIMDGSKPNTPQKEAVKSIKPNKKKKVKRQQKGKKSCRRKKSLS